MFGPYITRDIYTTYNSFYCYESTFEIESVKPEDIGTVYVFVSNDKGHAGAQIHIQLAKQNNGDSHQNNPLGKLNGISIKRTNLYYLRLWPHFIFRNNQESCFVTSHRLLTINFPSFLLLPQLCSSATTIVGSRYPLANSAAYSNFLHCPQLNRIIIIAAISLLFQLFYSRHLPVVSMQPTATTTSQQRWLTINNR